MKKVKKKVAIFPIFEYEVLIATLLGSELFEFVPIDIRVEHKFNYTQNLSGNWCSQAKHVLAMCEKCVYENDVDVLIGVVSRACQYPLMCGKIERWIDKDIDYYTLFIGVSARKTLKFLYETTKALRPKYSKRQFMKDFVLASKRMFLADKIEKFYLKMLPLVSDPYLFRKKYEVCRKDFIVAGDYDLSKKLYDDFVLEGEGMRVREKPLKKILFTGDFFIFLLNQFSLFDVPLFFAKYHIELVQPYSLSGLIKKALSFKNENKKVIEMFSKMSSEKEKLDSGVHHTLEVMTLGQIVEGVNVGVDGILYVYPAMCFPSINVSHFLKEMNWFSLPYIEITHDEHTSEAGIVTRLEAFLNILLEENKIK